MKTVREEALKKRFTENFGDCETIFVSAPGRTEIGGNHTDHQHGCVLAAAVDLDCLFCAAGNGGHIIRVINDGYPDSVVDLRENVPGKNTDSALLIGGVAAYLENAGYKTGGFNACSTSTVLPGSGISSSAAFVVAAGQAFSSLFNDSSIPPIELAKAGQFAENEFYGKPSGLMDETASAVGGLVFIDFAEPKEPVVDSIDLDFEKFSHTLCITDTKGNHSDLTPDYAAIPREMRAVAKLLGAEVLRGVNEEDVLRNAPLIRKSAGDRALLRAFHFFSENRRARLEADALKNEDFDTFLRLVNESGDSSFMNLQNAFSPLDTNSQPISVALEVSRRALGGKGAVRLHGGGFAGTVQAFVPNGLLPLYTAEMNRVFGENACIPMKIRAEGARININ